MKKKLLFIIQIPSEIKSLEELIDFVLLAYSCDFEVTLIFKEMHQKIISELFVKKITGLLAIIESKFIYCLSNKNTIFIPNIAINHCEITIFQDLLSSHDEVIVL